MHNRMFARVPKGLRPVRHSVGRLRCRPTTKQLTVGHSRCPATGRLMEPGQGVRCQEMRSDTYGLAWFRIYWSLPTFN